MTYDPNDAKSIFLHVMDLPTEAERAAFVEQACAGKPELKARVESLLKTALDPDSLLDQPVAEFGATQMVPQDASPVSLDFLEASDAAGSLGRLGGYEVLEVIGRGGMGVVLRAMDAKLNRVVAIKVLAPELASQPQARKRFLREAQAAAAVSHDHVVTIHAVDDGAGSGGKVPLLVMECIVGQSLQQKIDKVGALSLKEILRIGTQIASGLAAAHKQGLVHRDIKPANILLENGIERVKITDFGLARATDDVGITQSGQIAGTPQYMSPEQAQGHPVDQRSDLFSLGSVLYTLCTGRPAFRAESAVAVLRRVCDDTPRPINEVNAEVPAWLIEIVNRLMAKKPEDRYQTAREVASVLEQALAHVQQPEAVARPQIATPQPGPQPAAEPSGVLSQAWRQWWSERDRWFTMSVQTVLVLVYLACMVLFISVTMSNGRDTEGKTTFSYLLGAPAPWFKFEVYPEPKTPFRFGFFPWASSVLAGLLGCAAYYVYWRIEKVRNPKMSRWDRPAIMLGGWGVVAILAVFLGQGMGYATLNKPRVAKVSPVDFNGTWDSVMGPVVFRHAPVHENEPLEVHGTYQNGTHCLDGLVDPRTRAFEGTAGNCGRPWGRVRFVLSDDGQRIQGRYAQDFTSELTMVWDLRRSTDASQQGSPVTTTPPEKDNQPHEPADEVALKTEAQPSRIDLNGEWDSSWGPVTLSHPRVTGLQQVEVKGHYFNGKAKITGRLDPRTGLFRGTFHEPNGNGRLQLRLSTDATVIDGGFDFLSDPLEQVPPKQPWRMTRQNPVPASAPFNAEQARQHREAWAKYRGVEVERTNSLGMTLKLIPPGEFTQGTSADAAAQPVANPNWYFARWVHERREAERPPRVARISQPMYVGAHEVTVGQFAEFLKDTEYKTEAETTAQGGYAWRDGQWQRDATARWHNPGFLQKDDHPVSNVSWKDAVAFCEWLSQKEGGEYRLPTEAEWEYLCRAGTTTLFSTGDDPASLEGFANIADEAVREHHQHMTWTAAWNDGFAFTAPVGSFKPNNLGLFDMHGNVHEWCFDGYDANAYSQSPATDPVFSPTEQGRHVYRGGGWDNWSGFCRSADRYGSHSELLRTEWAGFRVVRTFSAPPPPKSASTRPRSMVPVNLNGDWDSRWQTVTFTHEPLKPGATELPVQATYYSGAGKIEGTFNLATRTFEGRFRETNGMNGPLRLLVSADGRTITGRYAYRDHSTNTDPVDLVYEWDMTRREAKSVSGKTGSAP